MSWIGYCTDNHHNEKRYLSQLLAKKCRQHPTRGPRYRVPRLGPQRGLIVATLGDQGTAPDTLAVYQDFDSAEFLVGLNRHGGISNPYSPLHF